MERKILITSVFVTLGFIAFLSGYLLIPNLLYWSDRYSRLGPDNQTVSLIERFNNDIDIKPSENKVPNTLPISGRKFLSFVSPYSDSQKIVAIDNSGNIVEIDMANLTERVVAAVGQTNITAALLSPADDSIIYSFYDVRNNKKHTYLNFSALKGRDLASGERKGESAPIAGDLKSAAFSPRGDQTVYLISTNSGGELLVSKSGNIIKRALKTRLGAAVVAWPADFMSVISYDKNGYGDLFVLKESDELNKILSYQFDLAVKWSPSGEKLLFSTKNNPTYDDQTIISDRLFYKDIKNNKSPIPLDLNANASKCLWIDGEEVICGVKNQAQIKDEFYKISLADGVKTLVATPSINLLTKELSLNRAGDTIFVLNDIDSKLYALNIK